MPVRGRYRPAGSRVCARDLNNVVRLADLIAEARSWGLGRSVAERVISSTVTDLGAALEHCEHGAVADLMVSRLRFLAAA